MDFLLESSYGSFSLRFTGYRNKVNPESEVARDIDFLEAKTKELYRTFYTKTPLSSAFADDSEKERYFDLMKRYLYDDYDGSVAKAWKEHPHPSKLTPDEVDALLE